MRINCKKCSKDLGEILKGSKLRIGIVHLCKDCMEEYDIYKSIADYKKTSPLNPPKDIDMGAFKDLFGDTFK